jgi:hypothetical protein
MRKQLVLGSFLVLFFLAAFAQAGVEQLDLRLTRDLGYGGLGNDIQGTFGMHVSGPDTLVRVEFYIDEMLIGYDEEAPFALQFNTGVFLAGEHIMSASGLTSSGEVLLSNEIVREFVTMDSVLAALSKILIPIFLVLIIVVAMGIFLPMRAGKKPFELGNYNALAGAAVCPRCRLPYSRSVMAPTLLLGKLHRCPHCGKVALVRRASDSDLKEAEARYRKDVAQQGVPQEEETEEDRIRRMLEESRYDE